LPSRPSSSLYSLLGKTGLFRWFRHGQKSPQIKERILSGRHLAQMILPHVRLDRSPREWLSRHLNNFAISIDARIRNGGHYETDARPCPPIVTREVMRK